MHKKTKLYKNIIQQFEVKENKKRQNEKTASKRRETSPKRLMIFSVIIGRIFGFNPIFTIIRS